MTSRIPPLTGKRGLSLWVGWLLGPLSWAMHQTGSYAVLPTVCRIGAEWPLHGLTVLTLLFAACGAWFSWRLLPRNRDLAETRGEPVERSRLLALIGLALCLAAMAGIVVESTGVWFLGACEVGRT